MNTVLRQTHHKLLEVNNSSLRPNGARINARENYVTMLNLCREYEVSVIISSDAHVESDVGNHALAHGLLAELAFPQDLVVNTSLEKLLPYIPRVKEFL